MNFECKAPKCQFSKRWNKCILPNSYNEKMAWCKRNNIEHKKCRETYNSIDAKKEACNLLQEKKLTPPIKSHKRNPIKILNNLKENAGLKVFKFIKENIVNRTETLGNRIKYFYYIRNFLKDIPQNYCLKQLIENNIEIYHIDDKIRLIKQIGTASANGLIYKTNSKNTPISVASKIMPVNTNNILEIKLNMMATKIVNFQLSKHFIMTYKAILCKKNIISRIKYSSYFVCLNEMAYGDLKNLCNQKTFLEHPHLIINVVFQCMISIYTFHQLGYSHNDCHWGNFLYQYNKSGIGYYHYIFDNRDYYIEKCKYNIMIYDFGLARPIINDIDTLKRLIWDYRRVLYAFILQIQGGWQSRSNIYWISEISNFLVKLEKKLGSITNRTILNEDKFFINYILAYFIQNPFKKFIETSISKSPLNSIPFHIDKKQIDYLTKLRFTIV